MIMDYGFEYCMDFQIILVRSVGEDVRNVGEPVGTCYVGEAVCSCRRRHLLISEKTNCYAIGEDKLFEL